MDWVLVKTITQAAGTTLAGFSGAVLSLNPTTTPANNPNGPPFGPYHFTTMPPGTAGPYELCEVSGGFAVYNPTGLEPVVFGWVPQSPNQPKGVGGISSVPLP